MSDIFDAMETYGATCWVPLCEWESPERFTREESVRDYGEHMKSHRAAVHPEGKRDG